ncbi:hypothetical protein BGX21_006367 [Mortierella sp. AD011]|nr:hypothetical protein BGX21_006367 [Mortierella sp. AD011]
MEDYKHLMPPSEEIPKSSKPASSVMQRFSSVTSRFKGICSDMVKDEETYAVLVRSLDTLEKVRRSRAEQGSSGYRRTEGCRQHSRAGRSTNPGKPELSKSMSPEPDESRREPSPEEDQSDGYQESGSGHLSESDVPLGGKRARKRSMEMHSEEGDDNCKDPKSIPGRGRGKSIRYKPWIERQRKGLIDPPSSSPTSPTPKRPKRGKRTCGICGEPGHNAQTCKKRK